MSLLKDQLKELQERTHEKFAAVVVRAAQENLSMNLRNDLMNAILALAFEEAAELGRDAFLKTIEEKIR